MRGDSFFAQENVVDSRRCLAVSSLLTDEDKPTANRCRWNDNFKNLMSRLDSEFSENCMIFSPTPKNKEGQLHWTLLQLVPFNDYEEELSNKEIYKSSAYTTAIRDALNVGGMNTEMVSDPRGAKRRVINSASR